MFISLSTINSLKPAKPKLSNNKRPLFEKYQGNSTSVCLVCFLCEC